MVHLALERCVTKLPVRGVLADERVAPQAQVMRGARPGPVRWMCDESLADRRVLDQPDAREELRRRLDDGAAIAPVPQGAGSTMTVIERLDVASPDRLHRARDRARLRRRHQQPQFMFEQNIGVDGHPARPCHIEQDAQVALAILRVDEWRAIRPRALNDEVQVIGEIESR